MTSHSDCILVAEARTSLLDLNLIIDFGRSAIEDLLESARLLRPDRDNDAHQYAVALHATALELYASCIAMASAGHSVGIPIVLRSIYESVIDLNNLVVDANYAKHMEVANHKQICKLLEQTSRNPLLNGMDQLLGVRDELEKFRRRLAVLKAEGIAPLKIYQRCKRVGRTDEYESLYGMFCLDSHNNIAALVDRHMLEVEGETVVNIFAPPFLPGMMHRLSFATGFLLQSAEMIHGAFQTRAPLLPPLFKRYEELRNSIRTDVKQLWQYQPQALGQRIN